MIRQHFPEFRHGAFAPALKTDPAGIPPVNHRRNFTSGFLPVFSPAGIAHADHRPEGHVYEYSGDRIRDDFFELAAAELPVFFVVDAAVQ